MFPKARKAMSTTELRQLGERLQQRKQQLTGGTWNRGMQTGRGAIEKMLKPFTSAMAHGRGKKMTTNGRSRKRAA